jgi:hypothetical protein
MIPIVRTVCVSEGSIGEWANVDPRGAEAKNLNTHIPQDAVKRSRPSLSRLSLGIIFGSSGAGQRRGGIFQL